MSDFELWQRVNTAEPDVVTWELEVDGQKFEREACSREYDVQTIMLPAVTPAMIHRAACAIRDWFDPKNGPLTVYSDEEIQRIATEVATAVVEKSS